MKLTNKKYAAFTIIELVLLIALLAILIVLVFIDIYPAKRIAEGRNVSRANDLKEIADGIYQYSLDNNGAIPTGLTSAYKIIGSDTGDCAMVCNSLIQSESESNYLIGGSYSNTVWDGSNSVIALTASGGPKLADFAVINSGGELVAPGYTASACIALATELVPRYLAKMLLDPGGSIDNTFYAVAVRGNNRISVVSCNAELEEVIIVEK